MNEVCGRYIEFIELKSRKNQITKNEDIKKEFT